MLGEILVLFDEEHSYKVKPSFSIKEEHRIISLAYLQTPYKQTIISAIDISGTGSDRAMITLIEMFKDKYSSGDNLLCFFKKCERLKKYFETINHFQTNFNKERC